ncbi:Fc.00g035130.m01.CDS01 [Cosmosporella sp. VM-42]
MSVNPDSVNAASGEFRDKVAPSHPLTHKGHAPGVKVGNDAAPEFHAETYPPGTAPKNRSFEPGSQGEIPAQTADPDMENRTSAADTLQGATSGEVYQGMGRPVDGMSSREMHGGPHKHNRSGLEGVGANAEDPIHKYGFDRDYPIGERGKSGDTENWPGADERIPTSAEELSHEHHQHHHQR